MFSYNLTQAIGWTVVHNIWQATVVALVCTFVLAFLRQKSANLRYIVANISLLLVLCLAVATFFSYYNISEQTRFSFEPSCNETKIEDQVTASGVCRVEVPKAKEAAVNWSGIKSFCSRNLYVVVLAWCAGVGFFLLRLLGNIAYVIYLRKRLNIVVDEYWEDVLERLCQRLKNMPKIELRESALVQSPLVIGYLKPMILFPIGIINQLNTNEVEAILAHELAHVMRHDYLLNILQNIVEALFYFHPAVWWLSSQIRAERENSCDDIALQLCENSITYAKALVTVQEMAHAAPQLAMAFAGNNRKTQLMLRVQRVLNQPKSKNIIMEKTVATAVVMLLLGYFAFAENKSQQGAQPSSQSLSELPQTQSTIVEKPKDFLTFMNVNEGVKDSIPSLRTIADGKYSFNDNTQNVDILVENKNVAQMTINGVEIGEKDFPKFEKMIEKIINARDTPASENNDADQMADLSENLRYLADLDQHNADIDRHNADQEIHNAEMSQFDAGEVQREMQRNTAQIEKAQKLQKEIERLSKKGVFRNNGLKVQQKIQALNQLGFQLNDGELVQMEDWGDASDMEPMPPIPPMVMTNFGSFNYPNQDNSSWKAAIEVALRNSGAVEDDEPAYFSLSQHNMMVNDKKYPQDYVQKYIKIYERSSGKKFGPNTMINLAINSDEGDDNGNAEAHQSTSNSSSNFSVSNSEDDKSTEIVAALIKEGFIKDVKHYSVSINDKFLMVNGKKLSNDVFQRYHKRFDLKKGTSITVSVSSDEHEE